MAGPEVQHFVETALGSAAVMGAVGHAVNTFPTPTNPYGKWLLGCIQWIVGQRTQSQETMK